MPQIAVSSIPEAQTASRFTLSILSSHTIIKNLINTAIMNDCYDGYGSVNLLVRSSQISALAGLFTKFDHPHL
jgi:hypothetical protein